MSLQRPFALQIGVYSYTIFAIQQEKFLDDFDMPEEIDRTKKEWKGKNLFELIVTVVFWTQDLQLVT